MTKEDTMIRAFKRVGMGRAACLLGATWLCGCGAVPLLSEPGSGADGRTGAQEPAVRDAEITVDGQTVGQAVWSERTYLWRDSARVLDVVARRTRRAELE